MHGGLPQLSPARRRGLGAGGGGVADTEIQGAFQAAYQQIPVDAQTQQTLNGLASTGSLQGIAGSAMASFESGQVPDMTGMVALAGTWPNATALSPTLISAANGIGVPPGAVAVALGVLAVATTPAVAAVAGVALQAVSFISSFFQGNPPPLPVPFCSVLGYQSAFRENESIPYGPTDPHWKPYPLKPGHEGCVTSCPVQWGDSCSADASLSIIDESVWCDYKNAAPGSFDQYCLAAMLANFELGYNCQPNFVSPQKLIIACASQWNALHGPSPSFTLTPLEAQDVNPQDPTYLFGGSLRAILGAAYVFETNASGPKLPINGGPLNMKAIQFQPGGLTKARPTGSAGMSTGAKIATGTAVAVGGGLAAAAIYAAVKHEPFGEVLSRAWQKTGGRVFHRRG